MVWSYGRPGVAGSAAAELSNPDDAYVLPNGDVRVADIQNCRIVEVSPSRRIVDQVGRAGACAHDPPRNLLPPNGDTPLADGGMLVTEIGGYVDRIDRHGRLMYSVRTPTSYPSDAQLLPNGDILVAGFDTPGRIDELTPSGKVVWTCRLSPAGRVQDGRGRPARRPDPGRRRFRRRELLHPAPGRLAGFAQADRRPARADPRRCRGCSRPLRICVGGGQSSSTDRVTRIDHQTGSAEAGPIGEPLSDLGAAVVDGKAYLVGG